MLIQWWDCLMTHVWFNVSAKLGRVSLNKTSYWAHGFTASAMPPGRFPKLLLKSSRGDRKAPFSHASCPFWSLDGPDAKGRVTVTCFPGSCCCNFSSSTNNRYGNLTAAQVFSLPIYSKTQLQTVTAPNTDKFKSLKSSDEKEWAGKCDQPRE